MATSNIYYKSAEQFGYFGILSGCDSSTKLTDLDFEKISSSTLFIGAGIYDCAIDTAFGKEAIQYLTTQLSDLEIPYDEYIVKGGHDWTVWLQLIKIFAENYLWK